MTVIWRSFLCQLTPLKNDGHCTSLCTMHIRDTYTSTNHVATRNVSAWRENMHQYVYVVDVVVCGSPFFGGNLHLSSYLVLPLVHLSASYLSLSCTRITINTEQSSKLYTFYLISLSFILTIMSLYSRWLARIYRHNIVKLWLKIYKLNFPAKTNVLFWIEFV